MQKINFEAIGTTWQIDLNKKAGDNLERKILDLIKDFSHFFSRFDPNSKITEASLKSSKIKIPLKYHQLIKTYETVYKLTKGKFTPLIGDLLDQTGYDSNYSFQLKKIKPVKKWERIIDFQPPFLNVLEPSILDFGAGGKGFLIDLIGELLKKEGIINYCIDAGGDILSKSKNPLKVGLEHPDDSSKVIGVTDINNESICASSGNRRKWGKYHHILNPQNRDSVNTILSTWVIAKNALIADCLATALFFSEPEELSADFQYEYLILYPDFTIKKSKDFPAELFYN